MRGRGSRFHQAYQSSVKLSVVKGQSITFQVFAEGYSCNYAINENGSQVSSGTIYTSEASQTLEWTAWSDGELELISNRESRSFFLEKITTAYAGQTLQSWDYTTEKAPWTHGSDIKDNSADGMGVYTNSSTSGWRAVELNWADKVSSAYQKYGIAFDAALSRSGTNTAELCLATATATAREGQALTNYLFKLGSNTASGINAWKVNEATDVTIANNTLCHYEFFVDKTTGKLHYSIASPTDGLLASGLTDLEAGVDATKLRCLVSRGNQSLTFDNFKLWLPADEKYVSFSRHADTYELISLWYDEPQVTVIPDGSIADVTFSSSNEAVATVDPSTGDVFFRNGGTVTIRATLRANASVYDEYTVTVVAPDAGYVATENTYTVTAPGKLIERTVDMIPGITMEFGAVDKADNMTIVRQEAEGMVATTLSGQGWRYVQPERSADGKTFTDGGKPVEGTYYVFKPELSGHLTVTGSRANGGSTDATTQKDIVLWDANTGEKTVLTAFDQAGVMASTSPITLLDDHVYYLYAEVPEDADAATGWSIFQLHAFKFEPDFRFTRRYAVRTTGELAGGFNEIKLFNPDETDVTYSYKTKGDINETDITFNTADGTLSAAGLADNQGGSIEVTATKQAGEKTFTTSYVLTVPYTTHKWDFEKNVSGIVNGTRNVGQGNIAKTEEELMLQNEKRAVTYKVRNYENATRMLYYLNKPVLANNMAVEGDNSMYLDETAGLIIKSAAKGFGTNVIPVDPETPLKKFQALGYEKGTEEYTTGLDAALRSMLAYKTNEVTQPDVLTTMQGTELIIPQLKKDQYVIVRMNRHSGNSGEHLIVTNLGDAEGKPIVAQTARLGITGIIGSESSEKDAEGKTVNTGFNITRRNYDNETQKVAGAYVFRVLNDGDVSLTVDDANGWTDFYDITVTPVGQFHTEMQLMRTGVSGALSVANKNNYVTHRGTITTDDPQIIALRSGDRNSHYPRTAGEQFTIEPTGNVVLALEQGVGTLADDGKVVSPIISNQSGFNFNVVSGTGSIKVTQKVYDTSGQYVVNLQETWLAVGQLEPQVYPKTWDFTSRNMSLSPATSAYSTRPSIDVADDETKLYGVWNESILPTAADAYDYGNNVVARPLFAQGAQLTSGSVAMDETIGLGVTVGDAADYTGVGLDGNSLTFVHGGQLLIPDVKAGDYVYVFAVL